MKFPDRQTLEKKQRLQEVLRGISQLFKRLHLSWEKVSEATASMETTDLEALIPLRGEPQPLYFGGEPGRDLRTELEKKRGNFRFDDVHVRDDFNVAISR